jgi:hypothetical protein
MAYYPPGREIVLFGGESPYRHGSEHGLGDTWVFGAHGWTRLFPRHCPPAGDGGLMAYDPRTRLLMLFGGDSGDYGQRRAGRPLSDEWAWNGTDWTRLTAVRLPTWMPGAAIAYDPVARWVTELAPRPGYPGSLPLQGDFYNHGSGRVGRWMWTGRSWSYHVENPAPGTGAGMLAPDPLSGGMLYFTYTPCASDGCSPGDPSGTRNSESWLWHDGHFTKESPARAPHPGPSLLMVSDARTGRVVAIDVAGRLWAWTGTTWHPLTSGRGPRAGAAAVYDPALGDLIVLGTKADTSSPTNQTWLWNGSRWIIGP